jgi:hypothetical protein
MRSSIVHAGSKTVKWQSIAVIASALILAAGVALCRVSMEPAAFPSGSIDQQMAALWQGRAHFMEVRQIDWRKPPYNAPDEGEGWFGNPMPFPGDKWYLFNRRWLTEKPAYCPEPGFRITVRESSDAGRSWSDPGIVVAAPGPEATPDACGVVDGSSYYDRDTDTWHMLAQCLAAHNAGGWMMCHYVRRGVSPIGVFTADAAPAVRGGQLWSEICRRSGGICNSASTVDEGTPEIVYKKDGEFYITFHGFDPQNQHGFRGVAKTADFHSWVISGPDLPGAPIFAAPGCQAWNPGCIGGGEASTLIAVDNQYMIIETPDISLACTPGQRWPIALMRAPASPFPPWNSSLWEPFPKNPLLIASKPDPTAKCPIQYPRWAIADGHVYVLYEDFAVPDAARRPLLQLSPGGGRVQ